MKSCTTIVVLTALVALVALPLALAAQAPDRQPARDPGAILHNPRLLARYLKLTPEQVATTQKLLAELKSTTDPLRAAEKTLREAFYSELEEASPNACDVGQAAVALHQNGEKIKQALQDFDSKFSAILTPEQLAKYEALKEAARLLRGGDGS